MPIPLRPKNSDDPPAPPRRLREQVREACRVRHYSLRTEEAYLMGVRRFKLFHGKRHPRQMGALEITEFLNDLGVEHHVAANTQMQAFSHYGGVARFGAPGRW